MIKALLKKQFLESVSFLFYGKEGKKRSPLGLIGLALLLVYGLGAICAMFYFMGETLCAPLVGQGLSWVYFAFMGTLATAFGIVGSVFTVKVRLYEAKDNDLLLSMPVPAWLVLFSRMLGLYFFALLFEGLIFVPATVAYFVAVGFSLKVLFGGLVTLLIMPFGTLAICSVLGWLIALLTAKLPAKNFLTVFLSVGFMVVYFMAYSKINEYLTYVMTNGGAVAEKMQTWLYPFGQMGRASTGELLPLLVYALIFVGLFAVAYFVISKTYIRLATANRGGRKVKYVSKEGKKAPAAVALLKKEFFRFTKNPMIALNCLLGSVFLLVLPFVLLFSTELRMIVAEANVDELIAFVAGLLLCSVGAMNMLSAASVSLEGESIWVTRSMPVSTELVFAAKAGLHFLITGLPMLFACVFISILLKISFGLALCMTFACLAYVFFTAIFGLTINLKLPNLRWTNELQAVKQSGAAVLSMFAEWGVAIAFVGGYFLFGKYLPAALYLLACLGILLLASGLLTLWLQKRGKKIFEELS